MIIKVKNDLDQNSQVTFLSNSLAAAGSVLSLQNAVGFAGGSIAIQIGQTGEEKSEIRVLSGDPAGTLGTVSAAVTFSHPIDTPVYNVKYNQIVWKRSTSGTSGTASAFATSNITPDSDFTQYDDTAGATTYAYKVSYYNSVLGTESSDSAWIPGTGYDFYSRGAIRERIKNKLPSTNFIGGDSIIDDWINEYLETMTNSAIDVNEDYALGTTSVTWSGTAEFGTITASDFKQIRRVWYTEDGGANYYPMTKMRVTDFKPNQIFNLTNPYFFMQGDNVIGRRPQEASGSANIIYYKLNAILDADDDLLPVPMRGYSNGFVSYAQAQAYYKDGKSDMGDRKMGEANAVADRFKRELQPRSKTGQDYVSIVETVGEDVEEFWV